VWEPFDEFDEFFKRMRKMFKDFDREFRKIDMREFEHLPGVRGFKIEIRDFGTGKPEVKVTRLGEGPARITPIPEVPVPRPKPAERPPKRKPVTKMLETNVGKVEKLDEVILTVQAPDVREEDVEIRRLGNTLEVIARKPTGEAYFAAFELPADVVPAERSIEVKNGMLVIKIPRRRRYPGIQM
jgi:HSP20 family molecular chaperone IbpA